MAGAPTARWTAAEIARRFGDEEVMAWKRMGPDTSPADLIGSGAVALPLRRFLAALEADGTDGRDEWAKRAYVNNHDLFFLDYKRDLDTPAMRRAISGTIANGQLFIGGAAVGSNFHCGKYANLFVQILGRKRWCFVPPRETLYLRAQAGQIEMPYAFLMHSVRENPDVHARLDRRCVVLEPGDVVFAPSWWWHQVENLDGANDSNVNVGSSSRWLVHRAAGKWAELANNPALSVLWPGDALRTFARLVWADHPELPDDVFFPLGFPLWEDWVTQSTRLEHPEWSRKEVLERWVTRLRDESSRVELP